ncbi:hypothetical protein LTR36_009040 [Oleoguttula mirabilis]|uniref:Aquaporin n=1 Tax=Oleoguttula mirabilis TaxID=1507867 RepID=A0AAV9J7E3_9PEZI|nr:hypothetical protein LTR36_009040 [Oleoguttula mirabilis]
MNIDKPSDRFLNLPGMRKLPGGLNNEKKELRLPLVGFLPNRVRNHFIAMMGEFAGTFLFLFFAFAATQVANAANSGAGTADGSLTQVPNANTLTYIALAFGFSLAVNAWVFFRISGGLFNPAVTLGMALIGAVTWTRAGLVFISQIIGAICAAAVVSALFPGPMNVSCTLGGGTSVVQGLFIEMFLTALLVFTIFMLAAEKHKGTFLAPVGIGLALFVIELAGVYYTGGGANPARAFGPPVVLHIFPGYHWIYWLGPFLGTLLAVGFYRFVKMLEYETANPGQDFNEKEAEVFEFDEENAATGADVARPIVQVGQPDFVADETGLRPVSSHDIGSVGSRGSYPSGTGVAPRGATAGSYPSGTSAAPYGAAGGINGNGAGRTAIEKPIAGSPAATGPAGITNRPDAAYHSGPAAEAGPSQQPLGGSYRVSGL